MGAEYEYIYENKQYELAVRDLKATFFDVISREEKLLTKLERSISNEYVEIERQKLKKMLSSQTNRLNYTLDLVNSLINEIEVLDSFTRDLEQLNSPNIADRIATIDDRKLSDSYKEDLTKGIIKQQQMEENISNSNIVKSEKVLQGIEPKVKQSMQAINDNISLTADSEPTVTINEVVPDKIVMEEDNQEDLKKDNSEDLLSEMVDDNSNDQDNNQELVTMSSNFALPTTPKTSPEVMNNATMVDDNSNVQNNNQELVTMSSNFVLPTTPKTSPEVMNNATMVDDNSNDQDNNQELVTMSSNFALPTTPKISPKVMNNATMVDDNSNDQDNNQELVTMSSNFALPTTPKTSPEVMNNATMVDDNSNDQDNNQELVTMSSNFALPTTPKISPKVMNNATMVDDNSNDQDNNQELVTMSSNFALPTTPKTSPKVMNNATIDVTPVAENKGAVSDSSSNELDGSVVFPGVVPVVERIIDNIDSIKNQVEINPGLATGVGSNTSYEVVPEIKDNSVVDNKEVGVEEPIGGITSEVSKEVNGNSLNSDVSIIPEISTSTEEKPVQADIINPSDQAKNSVELSQVLMPNVVSEENKVEKISTDNSIITDNSGIVLPEIIESPVESNRAESETLSTNNSVIPDSENDISSSESSITNLEGPNAVIDFQDESVPKEAVSLNNSESNGEVRSFLRSTNDVIKAILITKKQYNKSISSREVQEGLLVLKGILRNNEADVNTVAVIDSKLENELVDNGLLEPTMESKQKEIENMMEQANSLYKEGQVDDAQAMYAKISVMNKELQAEISNEIAKVKK